jgi:hypothetical protein
MFYKETSGRALLSVLHLAKLGGVKSQMTNQSALNISC